MLQKIDIIIVFVSLHKDNIIPPSGGFLLQILIIYNPY